MLDCLKKLSISSPGKVCYIGDHQTDILCAQAANRILQDNGTRMKVLSIGACYESGMDTSAWEVRPDYEAHRVYDIPKIVQSMVSKRK